MSAQKFKLLRTTPKNPVLEAFMVDFNQHVRFSYIVRNLRILLKSAASKEMKSKILDVGAGPGTLSDYLIVNFPCFIVNVEVNATYKTRNLVVAVGSDLPFRDNAFDFSVSCDVFEHVNSNDRSDFLKELLRCCKYGLVITYSKLHTNNPFQSGIRVFESLCLVFIPGWYAEHNENTIVDDDALVSALEENGANLVEVKPLVGVFTLFFTGLQCLMRTRLLRLLLNTIGYFASRLIDPSLYYGFGVTALKQKSVKKASTY
jgi:2-polyprenyl-3-methyl-5-hydroxy-6-metoxy-1,4-benzoquinol methylase